MVLFVKKTFVCVTSIACCASLFAQDQVTAGNYYQFNEFESDPAMTVASPSDSTMPQKKDDTIAPADTGPALAPDFINFGYIQSSTVTPYLQYEALTHIATPFVNFYGDGSLINPGTFTNRASDLRSGGAADRAGTKIIMCVRNNAFDETTLTSVMTNPAKQDVLVAQIAALAKSDTYCHGVNFDFEFSWGAATRDGITQFLQKMRVALPAPYEISVYTHATYSSTLWNTTAIVPNIDYMVYSTYDWATGATAHAIADFNSCIPNLKKYLDAGLPPSKLVLTWVTYGRRWTGVTTYNQGGASAKQSQGFYDGLYNTTLRKIDGGPFTSNYITGDETGWFTYNVAGTNYTTVHETPESLEYKISSALNFPGSAGAYAGVKLRGVGWWSLMWPSNYFDGFNSWDPVTNASVSRAPYYRHIDLLVQEILKKPGQQRFILESFENNNNHWRDPNESPDTNGDTDSDSNFGWYSPPGGAGRPAGTINAGRLVFDFESASNNRAFLRHELVNNLTEKTITDTNAELARVSKNTRVRGSYYVNGNYSTRKLRLALVDGNREVEVSAPITLPTSAGWNTFQWDINDPTQINAYATSEPALKSGNGVVATSGPNARDISFLGFIVEGGTAGSGTIYFDDITYEDHAPDNKSYVINEYRYTNDASEFVEIAGPPGIVPSDLSLVTYNSVSGSIIKSVPLSGISIPASGLYLLGDTGVPNATGSTGMKPASWSSGDDLSNTAPSAMQLYGSTSGYVYDSVVYRAFGGIQDLSRSSTRRVSREGYAWSGDTGSGLSGSSDYISFGRTPDGSDTDINENDFSLMPPTPGQPNGATGILGNTLNFTSIPTSAFQTYQGIKLTDPATAGLPASPNGGNAYRCVDTSGGGVIGYLGDAASGTGTGLDATGQIYIPSVADPAQAVAIGICGTQGSTFFSNSPAGSGYENGYWLIYENGTVNLANGLTNHNGQFEFSMASNNNMDPEITTALGSRKTPVQLSSLAGTWTTFHLRIDPYAAPNQRLIAQINNIDVYRGDIPAGGRTTGAFMVGHRETDGTVTPKEGTWIDALLVQPANPPAGVQDYMLY